MKIKSQFIVSLVVFSIVLLVIAASVASTEQQVTYLYEQQEISSNIERGASSLNSVSIDYFLYQEELQLSRWDETLSSLSNDLANIKANRADQQIIVNNVASDLQALNVQFDDLAAYLQSASRNVSVRIDPAFQFRWSGLAQQNQKLAFDASQLSQSISNQVHDLNTANIVLILSLVGTFGAFLATIYFMVFRKTLKSVTKLQNGIDTIGTGNLDYKIKLEGQNEITQLSRAFNQMTTNLKMVTASKTELEQTQASLRESEQRWATTLASVGDAVIATDMQGRVSFMNGVAEELTGWTLSEASQRDIREVFKIVNEQTRLEVENPIVKVLKEGLIVGLANHTILIRKDLSEIPIDDSGAPIIDKDGKITGVVLIFRDITERKRVEQALKESEQLYRTIFDNSQDGFQLAEVIHDEIGKPIDLKLLKINQAYERIIGVKASDVLGKTATFITPNWESHWFEIPDRVAKTGQTQHLELYNKDLNKYLDCYYFPYGENVVGTLFRDVTERKHLEQELQNKDRLAAIGATAGMVGHDIRNPLQAIISDVFLAKAELASIPDGEEKENALESLNEIEKNTDYINKIVQDLQDYARPLNPKVEVSDLRQIVEKMLTKNGLPPNVEVSVHVADELREINADVYYVNRIMYNLITNSIQAMPQGGKLTIQAHKEVDDIVITVQDTGVGIPKGIQGKMFTPMFTTKSKGQGFGLPVVKRMTESLGGTVTFESQENQGTKFIVRFPAPKTKH